MSTSNPVDTNQDGFVSDNEQAWHDLVEKQKKRNELDSKYSHLTNEHYVQVPTPVTAPDVHLTSRDTPRGSSPAERKQDFQDARNTWKSSTPEAQAAFAAGVRAQEAEKEQARVAAAERKQDFQDARNTWKSSTPEAQAAFAAGVRAQEAEKAVSSVGGTGSPTSTTADIHSSGSGGVPSGDAGVPIVISPTTPTDPSAHPPLSETRKTTLDLIEQMSQMPNSPYADPSYKAAAIAAVMANTTPGGAVDSGAAPVTVVANPSGGYTTSDQLASGTTASAGAAIVTPSATAAATTSPVQSSVSTTSGTSSSAPQSVQDYDAFIKQTVQAAKNEVASMTSDQKAAKDQQQIAAAQNIAQNGTAQEKAALSAFFASVNAAQNKQAGSTTTVPPTTGVSGSAATNSASALPPTTVVPSVQNRPQ